MSHMLQIFSWPCHLYSAFSPVYRNFVNTLDVCIFKMYNTIFPVLRVVVLRQLEQKEEQMKGMKCNQWLLISWHCMILCRNVFLTITHVMPYDLCVSASSESRLLFVSKSIPWLNNHNNSNGKVKTSSCRTSNSRSGSTIRTPTVLANTSSHTSWLGCYFRRCTKTTSYRRYDTSHQGR